MDSAIALTILDPHTLTPLKSNFIPFPFPFSPPKHSSSSFLPLTLTLSSTSAMGVPPRLRPHKAAATAILLLILLGSTASAMSLSGGGERKRVLTGRGGPGSWPPSCRSKCGMCTPCRAVHVAVQPGTTLPQEYYPEAWRCKCGNTLYMP